MNVPSTGGGGEGGGQGGGSGVKSLSRLCADYLIILLILRSVIALRVFNKLRASGTFHLELSL